MQFTAAFAAAVLATIVSAQTLNIPNRVGSIVSLPQTSTIAAGKSFDGGNKEFDLKGKTCNSDDDGGAAGAVFVLENGATLSNVIIGANQLEGVHCKAACTLKNVWFRAVCEDAISILGTGNALIEGGGAQNAKDKVVQHNGKGTVTIKNFTVISVGKLYRSCGNCSNNGGPRKVVVTGLKANGVKSDLTGINSNFGDTSTVSGSCGKSVKKICQEYKGIDKKTTSGDSPKLSSTAACLGAQGKLTGLPAC